MVAAACQAVLGCAHVEKRAPVVAVLPVETMGVPPEQGEAFRAAVLDEVRRTQTAVAAPCEQVDQALAQESQGSPPCRESDACLARAGRRVPSDSVLALTAAGLGNLWLIRGRLVRVEDGLGLQDVQESSEGGAHAVEQFAPQLAHRLFPDTSKKPWYRQWWVWTAVAVGLGTGAVVTWAATRDTGPTDSAVVIGRL